MKVRQSELKAFGECAKQYHYSKLLGLGEHKTGSLTAFGTVVHHSLEAYEQFDYNLPAAIKTFEYYWQNPERVGAKIDFWHRRTDYKGLHKRGIEMLTKYHEMQPWRDGNMVGTEIWFEVPVGEHVLTGTVDKLFMRPGAKKLEVWDFKTGSNVPERLRYNIQFTAYCYATTRPEFWQYVPGFEDGYERFRGWERAGWWYHARNGRMYSAGKREALDYQRLYLAIDEMDQAVKKEAFPLDVYGTACGYCPFVDEVCGSEMENPSLIQNV